MNKAVKNTTAIIIILTLSIILGYVFSRIIVSIEKNNHPLKYEDMVEKYSKEYKVPQEIIYAVIKAESGFRADVVSGAGAVGLMQIMPDTFDWLMKYQTKEELSHGLLYDPDTNIKYGTYYLNYLYKRFNSWDIAFAAYNGGPNREWLSNPEYINAETGEIVHIPIEETRNYVKRVNKNIEVYKRLYFSKN